MKFNLHLMEGLTIKEIERILGYLKFLFDTFQLQNCHHSRRLTASNGSIISRLNTVLPTGYNYRYT